jgi:hypothetical protein
MEETDSPIARYQQLIEQNGLDYLTPAERSVYAIWWFFIESNNGTIHQFFSNSTGSLARDALRGLEAFGAKQTAAILRKAISVFPEGKVPADFNERNALLAQITPQQEQLLSALTQEFYDSGEDVSGLADLYIKSHPTEFPH